MWRIGRSELFSLASTVVLFAIPFLWPKFSLGFDGNITLTVVSILFTILVGSFIAGATTNYFRLQQLISQFNAALVSLYGLARLVSPTKAPALAETIDHYMIASLDYDLLEFASRTEAEFTAVVDHVDRFRPEPGISESLFSSMHGEKTKLFELHQEMLLAVQTVVGPRHWFVLITLGVLIGYLVMALRHDDILSGFIAGILMVSCFQVLKLLHDIDTNLFLAKRLAFQNPQQVFRGIGRLPYYPQYAIDRGNVASFPAAYRVGSHRPGEKTHRIRTVGAKSARKAKR